MKQLLGSKLSAATQQHALTSFINRYTGDHKPSWVTWEPVQFKDDQDWLANTLFFVNLDGTLDAQYDYCESTPTWPAGRTVE